MDSNHWALIRTLAGWPAAGEWTALQNGFGNLAGVAAPALTGLVVEHSGQYFWAFTMATGFTLLGAFFYMSVIGRIEQVEWSGAGTLPAAASQAANTRKPVSSLTYATTRARWLR